MGFGINGNGLDWEFLGRGMGFGINILLRTGWSRSGAVGRFWAVSCSGWFSLFPFFPFPSSLSPFPSLLFDIPLSLSCFFSSSLSSFAFPPFPFQGWHIHDSPGKAVPGPPPHHWNELILPCSAKRDTKIQIFTSQTHPVPADPNPSLLELPLVPH